MMRIPVLASIALLTLAPNLLAAPQKDFSAKPPTLEVFSAPKTLDNCPVGFSAQRQSPTEIVVVGRSPQHRSGQGVRLSIQYSPAAIKSAEVTVHADSNKVRYLPLEARGLEPDLSRQFHLSASAGPAGLRTSDLWLDEAGSIRSVDLLSVTYADGTVWNHSAWSTCHAVISGYMLVGSR